MALISAVLGSFLGTLLGVAGLIFFDLSWVAAFSVYVAVSFGFVLLCTTALLLRGGPRVARGDGYEDALDMDWEAYASFQTDVAAADIDRLHAGEPPQPDEKRSA